MIKTVGLFHLPEGVEPELYWQEHTGKHAREILENASDLVKGYVISRVRSPLVGTAKFWGMVELWFEDETARAEFDRRTSAANIGGSEAHFEDYVRDFSAMDVEECVIRPVSYD
ncbi:hypothetical protein [Acidimangrovimonas sediminis]|uniref:hypothetical protein n=1 Tax=Acidimangrovimonas sediminis TaxID=2056283 RepID=UPI000C80F5EA|nr:hypothetical protein [Acidimangrovimonas sediminis]